MSSPLVCDCPRCRPRPPVWVPVTMPAWNPVIAVAPPRLAGAGMTGFSESGEADFAAGTITGYRKWRLEIPDLSRSPAGASRDWPQGLLRGQLDAWHPGVNTATTQHCRIPHEDPLPAFACGCGYWAYWDVNDHRLPRMMGTVAVSGVISGWGRTRIGGLGFRCAQAKILALCLISRIQPYQGQSGWYSVFDPPDQDFPQEALDRAQAWEAVIGDRLAQVYPEARIFEAERAMHAVYPPGPRYG